MFGSKTDKPKYTVMVGAGGISNYYDAFEYKILDNGIIELRLANDKLVTIMPGTPCFITGGKWNHSSE